MYTNIKVKSPKTMSIIKDKVIVYHNMDNKQL